MKKAFLLYFLIISSTYAQIAGCTDPMSENYNPKATFNDGSCHYTNNKTKPISSYILNNTLHETSGLIAYDNLLWTHNDDHDTTLYGMDTKGQIKSKINLKEVKNNDWEEISQDSLFLYIGDFGNNNKGNRSDLQILRIEKKSFSTNSPVIDTIAFTYDNQTDFTIKKANTTDFDCEAFVVSQDSIYLFTKEWTSNNSSVYCLPKTPGKYIAKFKDILNVKGLITGASLLSNKKRVILCGYSKMLQPFVYLLYDYKNNAFSTGNQRKIKLKLPYHQVEGIVSEDGFLFYITNEATIKKPFVNTPQQIHSVDLSPFLKD